MKSTSRVMVAGGLAAAAFLYAAPARAGDEAKKVGVAFEEGTPPFADVLAKAKKEAKPVFMDFFTEW